MGLIARDNKGTSFTPLSEGVHTAICSGLIDIGEQYSEKFDKKIDKVIIMLDVLDEPYLDKAGQLQSRMIRKEYSTSLNEKSSLRKDLESWRGKAFTEEELVGFDLKNILNKGCNINVINESKDGRTYSKIAGIMPLKRTETVEQLEHLLIFDLKDKKTWDQFVNLPDYIMDKILNSSAIEDTEFYKYYKDILLGQIEEKKNEMNLPEIEQDELPFK